MRFLCSATSRDRFFGLRRGAVVGGLTMTATSPLVGDREHAETEPPAQIAVAGVAFAALAARREFCRQPHLVCGSGPIDRLQDQFEIERLLEFADHHDRRLIAAQRDEVAAADFALDGKTELFEEAFDREIKLSFQRAGSSGQGFDLIRLRLNKAATQ